MQVIQGFSSCPPGFKDVVLTIGNFDGVHVGHRRLLSRVTDLARENGGTSMVVTFDPHPSHVLRPDQPVARLFPPALTYEEMARAGIDYVLVVPFDRERAQQTAAEFLQEVQASLRPRAVIVGHDFAFGHDREGSFATLQDFGRRHSWTVEKIGPVVLDGEVVSSSLLRRPLLSGDVERAGVYLARPYEIAGEVVHGDGRGAAIGFATANVETQFEILPAAGVYITEFVAGERRYPSVTNVGKKPTFHAEHALTIETHVLNIDERFYGQTVKVRFLKRLRAELKFPSAHELIKQIGQDVAEAKKFFGLA